MEELKLPCYNQKNLEEFREIFKSWNELSEKVRGEKSNLTDISDEDLLNFALIEARLSLTVDIKRMEETLKRREEREAAEKTNAEQKQIIRAHALIPDNWMVQQDTEEELIVVYKHGKTVKRLKKDVNLWKGDKKG